MFKNYLKIAFRNLLRYRTYTMMNICGLALGMACCLLIALYVREETSYDGHHANANRLYRVVTETKHADVQRRATAPVPLGPALQAEFPEAESVVRFWQAFRPVIQYQNKIFREELFYFTDIAVFEVFSFPLRYGDLRRALASPNSVVLSEAMAEKYFNDENPIGKILFYRGYPAAELQLTVTGVMQNLPANTHFDFDFLASIAGVTTEQSNWGSSKPIWTYVLLAPHTRSEQLERKLPEFVNRHYSGSYEKILHLEPLREIHLSSRFEEGFKPKSSIIYIYILSAIGFFILLIACINFMNLATALSLKRAREVGMRKVLGAVRPQLVKQFLSEALLLSWLALPLAITLAELFLPAFNSLSGIPLAIDYFNDRFLVSLLCGLTLLVGLLAGSYPAFFLSNFKPVAVLKGRFSAGATGKQMRRVLVVLQFAISTVLIVGTVVVYRQLEFVQDKNLGITSDQVVVMPYTSKAEALAGELLHHPSVRNVAVSQRVPVNTINDDTRSVRLQGSDAAISAHSYIIDENFLNTYDVDLIAGRLFSRSVGDLNAEFLINETAVKRFGWTSPEEALGKSVQWSGTYKSGHIVGVVRDFHLAALHEEIAPLVLLNIADESWWQTFISVRIAPENVAQTLRFLETTWRDLTPDGAYEYFFIDESFQQLHQADLRAAEIIRIFALLSIFVACLGLFGLAAFTAGQRTKEIGIRKVLGASLTNVAALLSKDFVKLVLAANVVAFPVAWYAMNRWLENFAYRIDLGWWMFALAGGLAFVLALLTVSSQAIKAALANPVDSLRYE